MNKWGTTFIWCLRVSKKQASISQGDSDFDYLIRVPRCFVQFSAFRFSNTTNWRGLYSKVGRTDTKNRMHWSKVPWKVLKWSDYIDLDRLRSVCINCDRFWPVNVGLLRWSKAGQDSFEPIWISLDRFGSLWIAKVG